MNEKGISWGWFQGGFKPSSTTNNSKAICGTAHMNIAGKNITDYVVHHEPFPVLSINYKPTSLGSNFSCNGWKNRRR